MKIAFILPSVQISGGIFVTFEHAIRMQRRGQQEIIMILNNKPDVNDLFWYPEARNFIWMSYDEAVKTEFDVLVSTLWNTCYDAYKFKSKSYLYFNQSVESKFFKDEMFVSKKYAESTYFLGMHIITEATWIRDYLKELYGIDAKLVRNGIRKDIYSAEGVTLAEREDGKLRVLVEGPLGVFFKNTEKTIELCLKSNADEVWLLTSTGIKAYEGVDRIFSQIPMAKTAEIYRSCDIIVKLSYVEGMFGPPLEMFHCGGTAIVYNVTGHDEYIKNDYNAYVVETDDEDEVVRLINKLKDDPGELLRLKEGAKQTAEQWHDWDDASIQFERSIEEIAMKSEMTRLQLEMKSKHFEQWYKHTVLIDNNNNVSLKLFIHLLKSVIKMVIPLFKKYLSMKFKIYIK